MDGFGSWLGFHTPPEFFGMVSLVVVFPRFCFGYYTDCMVGSVHTMGAGGSPGPGAQGVGFGVRLQLAAGLFFFCWSFRIGGSERARSLFLISLVRYPMSCFVLPFHHQPALACLQDRVGD